MSTYLCDLALVDGHVESDVAIGVEDGRFVSVELGSTQDGNTIHLTGLTVPGLANAHSHAFHRALRSHTQTDRGSFWTWRDLMYAAAARLDPDNYHRLARATFAEMVMAGITCVGEFHYVHHQPDGSPYANPNAMGEAVLAAAAEAGLRITLLDTMYLHGGLGSDGHTEVAGTQLRYNDRTALRWAERVEALSPGTRQRIGAAIHSVRAVDIDSMRIVADWASDGRVVHAHVSEQPAENEQCGAHYGMTPSALLHESGVLGATFTAVHATHLTHEDVTILASTSSNVCMCPTTERDLGDGIGPTSDLARAGVTMVLGSDSHAVIDHLEECRALELNERLRSQQRGIHSAGELFQMASQHGHRSLGWGDAGSILPGNRADLVSIDLDSVRTAGASPTSALEAAVFSATSADVHNVIVEGEFVVRDHEHCGIDVRAELAASVSELMAT